MRVLLDRAYGRVPDKLEVAGELTPEERELLEMHRSYARLTSMSDEELRSHLELDVD
jgi:hypothetical protein